MHTRMRDTKRGQCR